MTFIGHGSCSKAVGPVQDFGYGGYSTAVGPVQARLRRCGTQATHSKPSTSNSKTENYSVPRLRSSIGRVPTVANICVVLILHSVGRVPTTADSYAVPKPRSVGRVPATAITDGYYPIRAVTVLMSSYRGNSANLSKLIISFDRGQQL